MTTLGKVLLLACAVLAGSSATAGEAEVSLAPGAAASPPTHERFFDRFFQDGAGLEPGHPWVEGGLVLADLVGADVWGLEAVAAVAPLPSIELGVRGALLDVDVASGFNRLGIEDDTGVTDLEVAAKFSFKGLLAVGVDLTLPTGDEDQGLGTGETDGSIFLAKRFVFAGPPRGAHPGDQDVELAIHGGLRFNDDARILRVPLDGTTSYQFGAGLQWPLREQLTLLGELAYETERYEDSDDYGAVIGGLAWSFAGKLALRPALTVGFADAAPDWKAYLGLAYRP